MHEVYVYRGDIDRALRSLKAKMDADSVMEEIKNRRNFETSNQKKKRKAKALDKKRKQGR